MRLIFATLALLVAVSAYAADRPSQTKLAATCLKKYEQVGSGNANYKTCYYDCLGSTVTIVVKNNQLCPTTIQR
jgi:hypothetical protein